jgi:hypothetical protein
MRSDNYFKQFPKIRPKLSEKIKKIYVAHYRENRNGESLVSSMYFFEKVEGSYFGLSKRLSIYHFYSCSVPRVDRCNEFLLTDQYA